MQGLTFVGTLTVHSLKILANPSEEQAMVSQPSSATFMGTIVMYLTCSHMHYSSLSLIE